MPPMSTKSPVFAVCGGGHSLPSEPKRSFKSCHNTSSAESLFSDLLSDGSMSGNGTSTFIADCASTAAASVIAEDYADVFGGPPKYAALSSQFSQLSFKEGLSKVSDASDTAFLPFSSVSDFSAGRFLNQKQTSPKTPDLRGYSEVHMRAGYSYSKLRSALEVDIEESLRYRESGSPVVGAAATKYARRSHSKIKNDIKVSSDGSRVDNKSVHDSAPARMASLSRQHEEVAHKCSHSAPNMKVYGRKHSSNRRKVADVDDCWITVKDLSFSTEPSRFPPPSRPPPGPSSFAHSLSSTPPGVNQFDKLSAKYSCAVFGEPNSPMFTSSQEPDRRNTMNNAVEKDRNGSRKDAMELAEEKIRKVLEAREKAKLMVEKKFREKQRGQNRDANDTSSEIGTKHYYRKNPRGNRVEKERSRVQCCEDDSRTYEIRRRDVTRQRHETPNREIHERTEAMVQEREGVKIPCEGSVEELSPKISPRSVSDKGEMDSMPRTGNQLFEKTVPDVRRHYLDEDADDSVAAEKISTTKEQLQGSTSNSCRTSPCSTDETASSQNEIMTTNTNDSLALFSGDNFSITNFHDIEGESLERRKARWDRHCRTSARMAKALEMKKQRDLETQKEQAERHRAAELLDSEIRRWAFGKKGNLQALLCSLQYVLWPECGWQPVSYCDISTPVTLKRAYRKATLCVHPDKVQQRGATIAQKYIAEKVFDLLKEASIRSIY